MKLLVWSILPIVLLAAANVRAQERPRDAASATDAADSPTERARKEAEGSEGGERGEEREGTKDKPRFGREGTAVLSSDIGLGLSSATYDDPNVYSTSITFAPGVDRFVVDDLSLGIGLDLTWARSQGYDTHGATNRSTRSFDGISVRTGYNARISDRVSWWFRLSLGYSTGTTTTESTEAPSGWSGPRSDLGGLRWEHKDSGAYVYAFAPILVHPIPHWFIGFGPAVYRDFSRTEEGTALAENNRTTVSLRLVSGVWF